MKTKLWLALVFGIGLAACTEEATDRPPRKVINNTPAVAVTPPFEPLTGIPVFNEDSAYSYINKQVSFGPRVPNTSAHTACAKYLASKFKSFGLEVLVQEGVVTTYNNNKLNIKNIIAQLNPAATQRVVFFAHWDSRPYADRDDKNKAQAIAGANDGGSGVGVLLEMARNLATQVPNIGVDFILFDAEDYGQPQGTLMAQQDNTWALGSQYWGQNPPIANYTARFGILLDMVGAANAVFPHEQYSKQYANPIVDKVWSVGKGLGYGNYFISQQIGPITDDHLYVNEYAHIPTVDVIHYNPLKRDFFPYHHQHMDNMDIIDKATLKVVGRTMLEVVYREY